MEGDQPSEDPGARRLSGLPAFLANAASGIGGAIARTAGAAGTLITDAEIRRRGASVVASGASKGLRNIQHGIQTGASTLRSGLHTVGQGPRQIQSVLARLAQQIEEQRMKVLLEEQRDAPVDVQVGFQVYEDAPQELRSRLWMALLQHPELVERYQAVQRADAADAAEEVATAALEAAAQATEAAGAEEKVGAAAEEDGETEDAEEKAADEGHEAAAVPLPPAQHSPQEPAATAQEAQPPASPPSPASASAAAAEADGDWEVVGDRGARRWRQGRALLAGGSLHRAEPWSPAKEAFRQELMAAMAGLEWPPPPAADPESRYSTLLQISVGQEEVDDVIARDIHRTFPEYPLFGLESGQRQLFRVLKAYSLHDLETGYCQGMAFVAGLVLFFVPEEAAFQVFCRLLAATGPNLRRHYLPGLRGLKTELRAFDLLLARHLPALHAHLESHGAVPVLYASQWFLSAFSCPFPVGFACRLVDVMLVENSDGVLMRTALAVMAECEAELLMQEDFEEILTYLKVNPVDWGTHRLRRVLNAAIHASPVTPAQLADALTQADAEESALAPPGGERSPEPSPRRSSGGTQATPASGSGGAAAGVDEGESTEMINANAAGLAEEEEDGDAALERQLAAQQAELDTDYLAMVLDMDNMWGGGGGGDSSALEAYESALEGAAAAAQRGGASGGTSPRPA